MCMPVLDPSVRPSQSFAAFLGCLDIPPRDGHVSPRLSGGLPCHCRPSRSSIKSGRRGLTVTAAGTVSHTRCGQVIARFQDGQFTLEVYPEPERPTTRTATTPPTAEAPPRRPVLDDNGRDTGTRPGCDLG